MSLAPPSTTKGLGGKTRQLAGGASRRTGGYSQTRTRKTGGMTTTSGKTAADAHDYIYVDG